MSDQLDLRDLRYFEAIADAGHVGRAARTLHKSQPTLTGAIRRLEGKLGAQLFEKAGRGIRLTAAGAALHARAHTLRVASEDAVREVADVNSGQAGLVRIGLAPTAARFLLPSMCRNLLRETPGLSFRNVIENNDVLHAALMSGELDFTINLSMSASEEIVSEKVFRDHCVVVAARDHPIFRRKPMPLDLTRYGWLMGPRSVATREWLEHTFRILGLPPPRVQIETNQILFLPSLMEGTQLLSFVSRQHLAAHGKLKEVALKPFTWQRDFALCVRRNAYLSPAARRVIDALRTRGKALFDE